MLGDIESSCGRNDVQREGSHKFYFDECGCMFACLFRSAYSKIEGLKLLATQSLRDQTNDSL